MQVTIFGKKRTSADGKTFTSYFTKLTKKDGSEITTQVKFREECGSPKLEQLPMNIMFDKQDANYSEKNITYTDKEGNVKDAVERVMWVKNWIEGEAYVDTSMDEFED